MWAAGLAGGAAVVAWWKVVGAGYLMLAAGTALLLAIPAALGGNVFAIIGAIGLAAAGWVARRNTTATAPLFAAATVVCLYPAVAAFGLLSSLTGALALGGILSEMLLGHWYLVDPRLPRRPLYRLIGAAAIGVIADASVLAAQGAGPAVSPTTGWAFVVLGVVSLGLAVAVFFALRTPSYPGVMAATGLSYLAVLTVAGMSFVGRMLVESAAVGAVLDTVANL